MRKITNRGQSNIALMIATTAIVLFITVMILGKLLTTGDSLLTSQTEALAAFHNVTAYTWITVGLVAVGLLVVGGMGLVGMVGLRRR